jgi:hypothetical protein
MYITSSRFSNLELASLGLNLRTVEKMKKALRNKQIIIRLTEDEHRQITASYEALHMSQADYIRKKIFNESQISLLKKQEIHDVRVIGIILAKIFEQLKGKRIIDDEVMEIENLIEKIKMIVRRLNDKVGKS